MLNDIIVIMPMAGRGEHFKGKGIIVPKPLIDVEGEPMIKRATQSLGFFDEIRTENLIAIVRLEDEQEHDISKRLKDIFSQEIHILIDKNPGGPAKTALVAKELINRDVPIIIMDCDVTFSSTEYENVVKEGRDDIQGAVPVIEADRDIYSYSDFRQDRIIRNTAEKQRISPYANIGFYYFSRGCEFVDYAEKIIAADKKVRGEFYVSSVISKMIDCRKKFYAVIADSWDNMGTPEDLAKYREKLRKNKYTKKKKVGKDLT